MTWLDSAIGWVSPAAELRRVRARSALRVIRAYEGAATTRRTANWKTSGASANSEISSALSKLRNRSRDLVRNNPYGRRAIAALAGNAIGTGIMLGSSSEQLEQLWKKWCAEADFFGEQDLYGIQALVSRTGFEAGDCLIIRKRVSMSEAGRSGVPLKLKVLEGDFLDTTKHGPLTGGNSAVAGVEIDEEGRKVAYWVYTVHPGETSIFQPRLSSVRVPAEDVIYHFEKERPGQVLGVPRLATGVMRLRDLDEYQDALMVKKKIEACFAALITSDDDDVKVGTSSTTETDADGNSRHVDRMTPGMLHRLKPGESVTFGQPSSGPEVGYVADQLRAVAAGAGCTYEQLTGDLSRVNYSSMRGGRAEFKLLVEQYRWLTFVPQVCERIYAWFEEAAFLAGKIRTTEYDHEWTAPRWEYVNPKEDVETDLLELKGGLASHPEKIRERGGDFKDKVKEIADGRKALKEADVDVDYGSKAAAPAAAKDAADNTDGKNDEGQAALDTAILRELEALNAGRQA
jgi:lambda family phage portal protein